MEFKNVKSKSSQDFVPIKEIRDDVVILKDNSLRMVLMTSALNFALKSTDEQTAIILQYQSFLNSLDFSVQIFIQSRDLNIDPYLESLREREKEQINELLKIQMKEYIDFVKEFIKATDIVNKTFYVVVPYSPSRLGGKTNLLSGVLGQFMPSSKSAKTPHGSQEKLEEHKIQLQQRVDTVMQGLARMGVRAVPLNTEELIELFFKLYNPSEMESSRIPSYGPVK